MKVMTILGTRPELIRLSRVMPKLDKYCEHTLVHTGQNYDASLNDIFFKDLELRAPDYSLQGNNGSFGNNIGKMFPFIEATINEVTPDKVLILGDTNSGLSAIVAKKLGIPIYHMEAGNRCFSDVLPEEVNRRIIDHCSDILMPYTDRSRHNLLREGISSSSIYVTGNPISEVINYYCNQINNSTILKELDIKKQEYILVTAHRTENVDDGRRFHSILRTLNDIGRKYELPVIYSLHPRAKDRMKHFRFDNLKAIKFHEPFGLFDFITLEKNAKCVITDSGTVPEECTIMKVPSVTIRDVTERPEIIECGSNILAGVELNNVLSAVNTVINSPADWNPPAEYMDNNVSDKVIKIILGV